MTLSDPGDMCAQSCNSGQGTCVGFRDCKCATQADIACNQLGAEYGTSCTPHSPPTQPNGNPWCDCPGLQYPYPTNTACMYACGGAGGFDPGCLIICDSTCGGSTYCPSPNSCVAGPPYGFTCVEPACNSDCTGLCGQQNGCGDACEPCAQEQCTSEDAAWCQWHVQNYKYGWQYQGWCLENCGMGFSTLHTVPEQERRCQRAALAGRADRGDRRTRVDALGQAGDVVVRRVDRARDVPFFPLGALAHVEHCTRSQRRCSSATSMRRAATARRSSRQLVIPPAR